MGGLINVGRWVPTECSVEPIRPIDQDQIQRLDFVEKKDGSVVGETVSWTRFGRVSNGAAGLHCILPVAAAVALGCLQLFGASCVAHDAICTAAPEDAAPLDKSRDQWRERVAEARRRARQFTREHPGRPVFDTSSKADEERICVGQRS